MRRLLTALLSACAMALVAAASAQAQNAIRVGAMFSLSGPFAQVDVGGSQGVEMAVDEINRKGGIKIGGTSYKVDLALEDVRSQVPDTITATERLIRDQKVAVIFGPIIGLLATPAQEVTQPAKVIHFGPAVQWRSLVGKPDKKYLVNSQLDDAPRYATWIPALVRETKIKTVALLGRNDAAARGILATITQEMDKLGVKVLYTEFFEATTTDFSPFLTRIRGLKPDLLLFGYGDQYGVAILRQSDELKVAAHYASFAGTSVDVPLKGALGRPVDSYVGMSASENLVQPLHDEVKAFVQAYKSKYGKDPTGQTEWALVMYDYVLMWAKAVELAGTSTDNDKIIEKLRGMAYKGVLNIRIDERGQAIHDYDMFVFHGGKLQYQHVNVLK